MRLYFSAPILVFCCLAIGCGLGKYFSVRHDVAVSQSMEPTINPGDHFASVGIKNDEIDPVGRFDIVVFKPPPNERQKVDEDTRYIFRVIALGGEKFEMRKGVVFINDAPLDESSFEKRASTGDFKPVIVPANEYFLLGDNRPASGDSRYIGTIKRESIDGKVNSIISKVDFDNGRRW